MSQHIHVHLLPIRLPHLRNDADIFHLAFCARTAPGWPEMRLELRMNTKRRRLTLRVSPKFWFSLDEAEEKRFFVTSQANSSHLFCLFSLSSKAEYRAGDGWMDVFSSASHLDLKAPQQHILEMCDPGGIMEMANTFRKQSANIRNRTIHVIDQTSAYALCINRHLCQYMRTNGPGAGGRKEFSSFALKTNHKHYISSAAFLLRLHLPARIDSPKYRFCLLRRFVSFEMFPMRHSTNVYCVCSTAQCSP